MSEDNHVGRADLLSPVLGETGPPEPLFSTRAEFLTAFFGGPFAILLLSGMNANFLGRLKPDLWRYVLGTAASVFVVSFLAWLRAADPPPAWYIDVAGDQARQAVRWISRLFALVLWFLLWLPYRRYHKAAEVMGLGNRNPWKAAIASVVFGMFVLFLIGLNVAFAVQGAS
ncbi:MAG: hypothetical protein JSU82_02085 [Rhodospirillales bacterium]|nr:MAG: hypothetical protein JSU82_02085 [Rhodospirillales bacterium]